MSYRICLLSRLDRSFHTLTTAARVVGVTMFLLVLSHGAGAVVADGKGQAAATPCAFSDAEFDTTTNVQALDEYRNAIAGLLKREKFAELDCLADAARASKARFPGGGWKLRNIYIGLDSPQPGHPTQDDWQRHMELVQTWGQRNPSSVTATIALAESYASYAWDARGSGFSNSVSESGWKLFGERMEKAKAILDKNSALATKCPDWYIAMQKVAQGQSWELPQATALFQQAVKFEPDYSYYYRIYANYLLPKWSGEDGDASRFAEQAANHVGGPAGDILYFQIAEAIACGCQEPEFSHFSWPRIQSGFAALEKKYGVSMFLVNSFALMAVNSQDWVAADAAFKRIGDNWSEEKWTTEAWFKQNRDTAAQAAPMQIEARATRKEAQDNVQTLEGQAFRKDVEQKLAAFENSCLKESSGDQHKVELFLRIGKDGSAENAQTQERPDKFGVCMLRDLYLSYTRKETPFTAPPRAAYWVVVELDPATLAASAK
jgi:hypothetical protein